LPAALFARVPGIENRVHVFVGQLTASALSVGEHKTMGFPVGATASSNSLPVGKIDAGAVPPLNPSSLIASPRLRGRW